jgi:hypothetical protein
MSLALTEIMRLDPALDHQRIAFLIFAQEFPWDSQRALELALLRTFCAPSISRILDAAGEFERRPQSATTTPRSSSARSSSMATTPSAVALPCAA